jgi:hypothetical protein
LALCECTGVGKFVFSHVSNSSPMDNNTARLLAINTTSVFPLDYRITATVLHGIIFLFGVVGNVLVVIVVHRKKSMHIPTYCYLVRKKLKLKKKIKKTTLFKIKKKHFLKIKKTTFKNSKKNWIKKNLNFFEFSLKFQFI